MANAITAISRVNDPRASGSAVPGLGLGELWQIFTTEPVSGAAAVVVSIMQPTPTATNGNGLSISALKFFGLWVQCAGTTVNVTISILESWNDTATNFIAPAVNATVGTVSDTNTHVFVVQPTPMPYIQFKLTAGAGNTGDVTCSAVLWDQA